MRRLLALFFLFLPFVSGAEGLPDRAPVVGIPKNGKLPVLVRGGREERVRISFREKGSPRIRSTGWSRLRKSDDYSATLRLEGVRTKTPYEYRLEFENSSPTEWIGLRGFPEEGRPGRFRFVFSSCFHEGYKPHLVFEEIRKESPDFVALLGDNIYADIDGNLNKWRGRKGLSVLDAFRGKYRRNLDEHFQDLFKEVPLAAIWDDHDYGADNSDGNYRYKKESKKAFLETFPEYRPDEPGEGLYYQFRVADVDFFVLDTRWYKSGKGQKDDAGKTMLGERQLQWLLDGLMESERRGAAFKIIFSSVPWNIFGGGQVKTQPKATDSWSGCRRERELIRDFINDKKIRGVLVLSGDQHLPSVDLIQGGNDLTPISKSKEGIVYSLKGHPEAMFEVSASPLNMRQAWRIPQLPENLPGASEAIPLYRPPWWGDPPQEIPEPLRRTISVYGLVEVDGVGSSRKVSIVIKQLRENDHEAVSLFKIELQT